MPPQGHEVAGLVLQITLGLDLLQHAAVSLFFPLGLEMSLCATVCGEYLLLCSMKSHR